MNETFDLHLKKFYSQLKNLIDKIIYIAIYLIPCLKQIFGSLIEFIPLNPPTIMNDKMSFDSLNKGVGFNSDNTNVILSEVGAG